MTRAVALLSALLLIVAACGDDDSGVDAGPSGDTTEPTTTSTDRDGSTSAAGELPGQRIDIFPYEGATLTVVGVAADDVLNVRTGPGVDFVVAYTLGPTAEVTATGNNRRLDSGRIWVEVAQAGDTGWANAAFLLQPGEVTDETAALYPTPADRPTAETLTRLAGSVADRVGSEEPASEVTVVDGPHVGGETDLSEVTVDVIGLGDDAVGGFRLHLLAEEDPGGESFTLRSVEQQLLCSRGVSAERLCA